MKPGDSIPLDSKDSRYGGYLERVLTMIKEKWQEVRIRADLTYVLATR